MNQLEDLVSEYVSAENRSIFPISRAHLIICLARGHALCNLQDAREQLQGRVELLVRYYRQKLLPLHAESTMQRTQEKVKALERERCPNLCHIDLEWDLGNLLSSGS